MDEPRNVKPARDMRIESRGGLCANLKARADDFIFAGIILLSTGDEVNGMNLLQLREKSTMELRDIYNGLAEKSIKRFADRVDAERRTAERLKEAGQWEGDNPDGKTKKKGPRVVEKAASEPPPTKVNGKAPKAAKPAKQAKQAPAKAEKKAPAAKAPAASKTPKVKAESKAASGAKRGAPLSNKTYVAVETDRRMHEGSARTKVYNRLKELGDSGADREALENHFVNDESVNVKASIDYLIGQGIVAIKGE
jgi:hypothetical protein